MVLLLLTRRGQSGGTSSDKAQPFGGITLVGGENICGEMARTVKRSLCACGAAFKREQMLASKREQWGSSWEVEEDGGFGGVVWVVAEDGDVAVWMLAVDEASARRSLDAQALSADGHATIGADEDGRTHAPDVRPPRAARRGAQSRAVFLGGELPGGERRQAQFAVALVGVAMEAEFFEQRVGGRQIGDGVRGEDRREAVLPVLMTALDLALGLRRGGVAERDAVKVKRGTELGESAWDVGEKERMVIDVEREREAVSEEGRRQEIKVGEEIFALVEPCAGAQTAAIIEHIEQREEVLAVRKKTVRRGVELPEPSGAR